MKFPWEIVENKPLIEHNQWQLTILFDKGVPIKYTKKPDDSTIKRLEMIFKYMKGSRNFILIVSNRTAYVNSLFYYLAATWITSTSRNFEIVNLTKLKEDDTLLYKMEYANLLMIPFNDSDNYHLRNVRNAIGSILIKRQIKNLPTIIELYVKKPPASTQKKELLSGLKNLSTLYGEQCASTFLEKDSNIKILTLTK